MQHLQNLALSPVGIIQRILLLEQLWQTRILLAARRLLGGTTKGAHDTVYNIFISPICHLYATFEVI